MKMYPVSHCMQYVGFSVQLEQGEMQPSWFTHTPEVSSVGGFGQVSIQAPSLNR